MNDRKKSKTAVGLLEELYPDADCSLEYDLAWQLLFATRLSAQCTDARVNIVSAQLYSKYPTLEALTAARQEDLENIVFPCGLYKMKARDIKNGAAFLIENYGGNVPDNMEELLKIPGVGRKTANLILGDIFGKGGIVADTHCIRICNRLGLCKTNDPYKVETIMSGLIEESARAAFCHRLVLHGRACCRARSPFCGGCVLADLCEYNKNQRAV